MRETWIEVVTSSDVPQVMLVAHLCQRSLQIWIAAIHQRQPLSALADWLACLLLLSPAVLFASGPVGHCSAASTICPGAESVSSACHLAVHQGWLPSSLLSPSLPWLEGARCSLTAGSLVDWLQSWVEVESV